MVGRSLLALLAVSWCLALLPGGASCARAPRRGGYAPSPREALAESFFEAAPRDEANGTWAWPRGFLGPQLTAEEIDLDLWARKVREGREAQAGRRSASRGDASSSNREWFGFIPSYLGTLMPQSLEGHVSEGHCFEEVGFEMDTREEVGTELHMLFYLARKKEEWYEPCVETMVVFSGSGFKILNFGLGGAHKVTWSTDELTSDEKWYLYNRGLHVFLFRKGSWASIVEDVYYTASLFVPFATQDVNPFSERDNLEFLQQYQQIKPFMAQRSQGGHGGVNPLNLDPALVQSGDFFGILRLDGVDPMLAWATGSTTGHTAVAIRKPSVSPSASEDLHICESTAKDAYWDTNGVQCTPFAEWTRKAARAEHNVVWAPLSEKYRKKFNSVAAWKWFEKVNGLDYGYENMIFSWIDTLEENYPCIPPKYDRCMSWLLLEVLSIFYDRISTVIPQKIWLEALNKRVGTQGLRTLDVYRKYLSEKPAGADATVYLSGLAAIPEQDSWKYQMPRGDGGNGTVTGQSMVCSVFVCHVWKEAGIFQEIGSNVNCAEFTPYDVHKLAIFDGDFQFPPECAGAEEENLAKGTCQVMGKYTLHLNDFNTVTMRQHMAETCPSFPPKYQRDPHC